MPESLASSFSKKIGLYFAILLLGCLCTGSVPLWVRLADVGPATAGVWRMAFALPFLLLWMYIEPKGISNTPRLGLRTYGLLAFAGGTFALDILLFNSALIYAPVTNVSILGGLAPFVIIFKAILFERLRMTKFMTGALVLAFLGVVFLTLGAVPVTRETIAERNVFLEVMGSILALASSISYGLYLLCLRQVRNAHVSTGRVVGISASFAALGCLIIAFLGGENLMPQTTASWLNLIGLGVIGHVLGHGLMTISLRHVPAILASSSIFLLPAFSTFLAWIFLGESITWLQLFGGGLILSALLYLSPRQENAP